MFVFCGYLCFAPMPLPPYSFKILIRKHIAQGAKMKTGRALFVAFALSLFIGFAFANTPTSRLKNALSELCTGLSQLVPVAAMLMVLLASVIYATGQMMGAETRARANVWATSALTGALIGILISVIAPTVLQTIAGSTNTIKC
jgi:hypothetical protein